jgi:hypothetical protein
MTAPPMITLPPAGPGDACPGGISVTYVCVRTGRGRGCHRLRSHRCVDGHTYDVDARHEQLALL